MDNKEKFSDLQFIAWIVTISCIAFTSIYVLPKRFDEFKRMYPNGNFIYFLPPGYLVGLFIGTFILPIVVWIVYFEKKSDIKRKETMDLNSEIKLFESDHLTSANYIKKSKSLFDLKEKEIISIEEFEKKYLELLDECRAILKTENTTKRNREILQSLEDALANGVISKEEYLSKKQNLE